MTVRGIRRSIALSVVALATSMSAPAALVTHAQDASPGPSQSLDTTAPSPASASPIPSTAPGAASGNLVLTFVEARPAFYSSGYAALRAQYPGAWIRRGVVFDGDDSYVVALLTSPGDVVPEQLRLLRTIGGLTDVTGSSSWWGTLLHQTRPLAEDGNRTTGFFLAELDPGDDDDAVAQEAAALETLRERPEVWLVGRTRGGVDLVVLFDVDPAALDGWLDDATAIETGLEEAGYRVVEQGLSLPADAATP